ASRAAQVVIHDACRGGKRVALRGDADANGRSLDEPIGWIRLPVEVEPFDAHVTRIDRRETAYFIGRVNAEALVTDAAAEGIVRRSTARTESSAHVHMRREPRLSRTASPGFLLISDSDDVGRPRQRERDGKLGHDDGLDSGAARPEPQCTTPDYLRLLNH